MKRTLIALTVAIVLLTALVGAAGAATGTSKAQIRRDLAKVRRATDRYHDVTAAIAAGYVPSTTCVAAPGLGTMGFHYVNPGLAMDPGIDLAAPEILLYAVADGELKLVAVEYFYGIGAPDTPIPDPAPPAPVLFGKPFDGPMLAHEPGMPPHYDLHVWVWQANPSGIFAQFNPNVSCE